MLDYLENRNDAVRDLIAQLILLHKKEKIKIATSPFNIAELIDKEFEIKFSTFCITQHMSFDEIRSKKNDEKFFSEICQKNEKSISKNITKFIFDNNFEILHIQIENEYKEVFELIYKRNLESQDALIVATAITNKVPYFISNDSNLNKKIGDIIETYNLHDQNQLEQFRNYVLESI